MIPYMCRKSAQLYYFEWYSYIIDTDCSFVKGNIYIFC